MRSSRCLYNSVNALRRVFMPKAFGPTIQLPRLVLPGLYLKPQIRTKMTAVRRVGGPQNARPGIKLAKGRLPRDEEITHRFVQVVGDDGRLSEPQATKAVLSELDPTVYSLRVVALPEPQREEGPSYPVCKIVDKKKEYRAQMEKAKEERRKAVQSKEIEITWAIDPHDLGHRLKQLHQFLEKGFKVEISLLAKKRKRQASKEEAAEVLRRVKVVVGEVPGAKESKAMEGELLQTLRLFVEGPRGGVK